MPQAPCGAQLEVEQDWRAEISCRIDQVGGSFSVFLFLGNVPANPADWLKDEAFVGTFDIYAPNSSPYHSGTESDSVASGFVLLKGAIRSLSRQSSMDDDVVVPILSQSINWGVQRADGERISLDMLPSLQVTVQRTPIIRPVGKHPYEGKPVYYHDITRGRPGGFNARQN